MSEATALSTTALEKMVKKTIGKITVISGQSDMHNSHEFDLFSPLQFRIKMSRPITQIM